MSPPRLLRLLLVLAVTSSFGGCSVAATPRAENYEITVFFGQVPSLYEGSGVKIMGSAAGEVRDIALEPANDRVKVVLSVPSDIPVRADARAAIISTTIIGERNVVLYPPWEPGKARLKPGSVIPEGRTDPPVEVDDALEAFARLADSVDTANLRSNVASAADLLRGNGAKINSGLGTIGDLTRNLAAQDQRLVSVAVSLNELAGSLNERDDRLKALFTAFNDAGGMLADERARLRGFLTGLESVVRNGDGLVQAYHEELPSAMADLSELVMTLKVNSASLAESIASIASLADVAVKAWDRDRHAITLRIALNATARTWLQPLFDAMGWGKVPCAAPPLGNCPGTTRTPPGRGRGKGGRG